MEIRTERLLLRHARPDDLDAMHAVLSNAEAMRWWSTPPHASREETRVWLDSMIEGGLAGADDYVVELDGRVVGKAGFWRLPDVGYILHPDVWGRGLAFEALEAVIGRVFAVREVQTLTADVDPANVPSIRLLERLGFVRTGAAERTWKVGEVWVDSLYYELDRSRWSSVHDGLNSVDV